MSMGLAILKSLVSGTHLGPLNVPDFSAIEVWYPCKRQLREVQSGFLALLTLLKAPSSARHTPASATSLWMLKETDSESPSPVLRHVSMSTQSSRYHLPARVLISATFLPLHSLGVLDKVCLLHPRIVCSSPISKTSRDKLWHSNVHSPFWMTA